MNYNPDLVSSALKMLGSLGIILAILIALVYFAKKVLKRQSIGSKGNLIRVLANCYVGVKKNITMVEVPGAVLVLGVTNNNIALLTAIENEELLEEIRQSGGKKTTATFSEHLKKVSSSFKQRKGIITRFKNI